MGTRHAIGWLAKDGKPLTWYNQFDGYPTGVGRELQKQLAAMDGLPGSDGVRWIANEDATPSPEERQWAIGKGLTDASVSTGADWYATLRNLHGRLDLVVEHKIALAAHDFLQDSLFCEWGYLIDETTNEVIVLRGFNQDQSKEAAYAKASEKAIAAQRGRGGADRVYYGCTELWRGSKEAFLALDMEALEAREDQPAD